MVCILIEKLKLDAVRNWAKIETSITDEITT